MPFCLVLLLLFWPVHPLLTEEPAFAFKEVWAYFYNKEKHSLKGSEPITDMVLFSAAVNEIGVLTGKMPELTEPLLKKGRRVHLAITAVGGKTLMHFCLFKDAALKKALIASLIEAAGPFNGLQIDFETIRAEEKEAFLAFLRQIRGLLPKEKILSVCLPARTRQLEDAFPYSQIASIVDRVIIMAYDEHWGGGKPGPMASIAWCERVALYAKKEIPPQKLVLGIPFYGRVWQTQAIAKTIRYSQALELWKKHQSPLTRHPGEIPSFSFKESVEGIAYFEDVKSLKQKLKLYELAHIENIAFWRVSQEPIAIWSAIKIAK